MNQELDTATLLKLRRATRATSQWLESRLRGFLATLSPLMQPRQVFGQYLRGSGKQSVKGEAEAFAEVRDQFLALAESSFSMRKQLESPFELANTTLDIVPAEYVFTAESGQQQKAITITQPLRWVLCYSGFTPRRLQELMNNPKTVVASELPECVLHFLVLHTTLAHRPGVQQILEALRFPLRTDTVEEFGALPVTYVECPLSSHRPADEVMIESTELSGNAVFEELLAVEELATLQDPLRRQLTAIVKQHGESLLPSDGGERPAD